ncbi:zinc metallopeptidase [Bacillus sp. 1NLA3E]|uniref:zinc metallopeptidase n=1 Tax=Bacillus sp. 1NLA3E TaxID=666686 RepID=UPI000247EFFF|nr:zinc metallopeptidase [Bacillus sp. 1NLA3E]
MKHVEGVKIRRLDITGEDLYDPIAQVIQLGKNVYGCKTIYSLAVGCHEVCHAMDFQYLRFLSAPITIITKFVFIPLFLLSLVFQSLPNYH